MDEGSRHIIQLIKELDQYQDIHWLNNTLYTWQWWIGISLSIIPWVLWIVFHKRNSRDRLLFVGFFVMLFTSYLDFIGVEQTLWYYEYKVVPTIPAYIPWDFSLFPVIIMLMLQYKPDFNPYIKAIAFGAFASFVAEPFFIIIELYSPLTWRSIYSFPIYIALYLICHFISKRNNFKAL